MNFRDSGLLGREQVITKMNLRRAECLLIQPVGGKALLTCLASRNSVKVSSRVVAGLLSPPSADEEDAWSLRLALGRESIGRLVQAGVLLMSGSPEDFLDLSLRMEWTLGLEALALHVLPGATDGLETRPAASSGHMIALHAGSREGLQKVISQRRSIREFEAMPLDLSQTSALLFAGLGRLGEKRDVEGQSYALTTAPSGGACDPMSAIVVARAVGDVRPGVYRYLPGTNELADAGELGGDEGALLTEGQRWGESAPLLICLAADIRRTMRRYEGLGTYQVILLEAGHRAQNILLAATEMGLGACVTAGIDRRMASTRFGLEWPWQSVLYTIAVGVPQSKMIDLNRFDM